MVRRLNIEAETFAAALPELAAPGFLALLDNFFATEEPYVGPRVQLSFQGPSDPAPRESVADFVYQPLADQGSGLGIFVQAADVTDAVRTQAALHESEAKYQAIVSSID